MNKHPSSPCFSCQWYRKMTFVEGYWVFVLPNEANFASYEDEYAWCLIEVLDRFPAPLEDAAKCQSWKSRDTEIVVTEYAELRKLHPAYGKR